MAGFWRKILVVDNCSVDYLKSIKGQKGERIGHTHTFKEEKKEKQMTVFEIKDL